jgi:hypothetical protein
MIDDMLEQEEDEVRRVTYRNPQVNSKNLRIFFPDKPPHYTLYWVLKYLEKFNRNNSYTQNITILRDALDEKGYMVRELRTLIEKSTKDQTSSAVIEDRDYALQKIDEELLSYASRAVERDRAAKRRQRENEKKSPDDRSPPKGFIRVIQKHLSTEMMNVCLSHFADAKKTVIEKNDWKKKTTELHALFNRHGYTLKQVRELLIESIKTVKTLS